MIENLIEIEKILDNKLENLSIWKLSFQDIFSNLLLMTENIDYKGDSDTAMDYISRTSLIYPLIKKYASVKEIESTTHSLLNCGTKEFLEDINFLISYAHFSLLMPQVHRKIVSVNQISNTKFKLDFTNENIQYSELIDKLYSTISLQISFSPKEIKTVKEYTNIKAANRDYTFKAEDIIQIKNIYEHHSRYNVNIKVIQDEIIESKLGFNYEDFQKFSSALKAFADYFILLSRSLKEQVNDKNSAAENEQLMSESMEWSVCCLKYQFLGCFLGITDLEKDKFDKILSYFLEIYSNETNEIFEENSFCGEGFLPPIVLIQKSIIFSPHALRYLVNFNNILYSINKKNKPLFDNEISMHLEPTLINQLEYLFSSFENLEIRKNVNYTKSEIDIILLSKSENLCIAIQVKTTIAPDSSRSVERVQDRTIEAFEQIKIFESLKEVEKIELINKEFNTTFSELKFVNLIIVRSSAGSDKAWEINKHYRILNYALVSKILCDKLKNNNTEFKSFDEEILKAQNELIEASDWKIDYETLKIDKYEICFPNINFDDKKIISFSLKTFECFPKLEFAKFD